MIKVTIAYPTDPLGVGSGGTDTCIRDILQCAPGDIRMSLVGVTTDPVKRPVGRWTRCELNGVGFDFYPLIAITDLTSQNIIPASVRYTLKLVIDRPFSGADVIHFDRIEPIFPLLFNSAAKVLILHQNMNVLYDKDSDIRWKYFPALYFFMERIAINRVDLIKIVREDAVYEYQRRFPAKKDNIHFLPTWMNPSLFYPLDENQRQLNKTVLMQHYGWDSNDPLMLFVGRLDHQKDPKLLINSVEALLERVKNARLIMIGDGVLRDQVEKEINDKKLEQHIKLFGAAPPGKVADILRVSDLLVLSSAYEGMPRCVVEALGCGVPVVSTDVGEVCRLVESGVNGYLVKNRNAKEFSDAMVKALSQVDILRGAPCVNSASKFRADVILAGLYNNYRECAKC